MPKNRILWNSRFGNIIRHIFSSRSAQIKDSLLHAIKFSADRTSIQSAKKNQQK